ncbi:MFS transporter [Undibacterium terreum]|uniref:MFS transporter n=1 Tax=Undibacterium terreum TaxID=1224302 RepID=A0A916XF08_9BURK|nr:MFS transporter [Undibacterium terreum]GGC68487.1 MFS transporter [Undibacterium terreum]
MNTTRNWQTPVLVVLCGGILLGLSMGMRNVQSLFMLPMISERGWTREQFGLAIALQNIVWGLSQPLMGMIADRFGSVRVLLAGSALYAVGLYLEATAGSIASLNLGAGLLIGLALSGTAFATVYGAVSRIAAPAQRSWALGMTGAIGGLCQFAIVPITHGLMGALGWAAALVVIALLFVAAAPTSFALQDQLQEPPAAGQSMSSAIRAAFSHRGFWLLNAGFLACGFQLAFISNHLPAYLMDKGMQPGVAVTALAIILLTNIVGTYYCGYLGGKYSCKYLLSGLYLIRSAAIAAFIWLPISPTTVYLFAALMGLTWLGTVPLTNGIVSQVFGMKYLATLFGFVFFGHQLGAFFGVWLGAHMFDATHSYHAVWMIAIALGLLASLLHLPIDDRQMDFAKPLAA